VTDALEIQWANNQKWNGINDPHVF